MPHSSFLSYISMKNDARQIRTPKTMYIVCFILTIGILMTVLNVYQLRLMQKEHYTKSHYDSPSEGSGAYDTNLRPIVWVKAKNEHSGYLDHVFAVFRRLGYTFGDEKSDWDVLWHHDYPFMDQKLRPVLLNLPHYKMVNHVPGSGFYTSKVNLATSNITFGIPPAFELPKRKREFLHFAYENSGKLWVQKSNKHRGIMIRKLEKLNLELDNTFVQEYISNPLIIDKRKFDIGIYTVITSVNPLRVYLYEGDTLLRFCPKDYYPFDADIVDKYVVGDEYTPTWKIPSLSKYYKNSGMTFKESLNSYIRSIGKDTQRIWSQIRETIRQVFHAKQKDMKVLIENYKSQRSFFELSRFDFVIDEDLNVFLMEANMSPNLSSAHFAQNKLLYEQVLFNLFSLVGLATRLHGESRKQRSSDVEQMIVSDNDIAVIDEKCASNECNTCEKLECKLCGKCMSDTTKHWLKRAYSEHMDRMNMRRVIPVPLDAQFGMHAHASHTTEEDQLLSLWFRAKCQQDSTWCR